MNMVAQVCQAHFFVARVLLAKLRQYTPHGLVFCVVIFELLQGRQHAVPTAFGNANGEHDEKAVEPGLFNHHAVLG